MLPQPPRRAAPSGSVPRSPAAGHVSAGLAGARTARSRSAQDATRFDPRPASAGVQRYRTHRSSRPVPGCATICITVAEASRSGPPCFRDSTGILQSEWTVSECAETEAGPMYPAGVQRSAYIRADECGTGSRCRFQKRPAPTHLEPSGVCRRLLTAGRSGVGCTKGDVLSADSAPRSLTQMRGSRSARFGLGQVGTGRSLNHASTTSQERERVGRRRRRPTRPAQRRSSSESSAGCPVPVGSASFFCRRGLRRMARLDVGGAGVVASFVVGADCGWVGVFWDTRHAVREVVQEPHDPGVGPF